MLVAEYKIFKAAMDTDEELAIEPVTKASIGESLKTTFSALGGKARRERIMRKK